MLAVALSQYIFMHRSVTGKWLLGIAEHWSPARLKKMGTVIVLQQQTAHSDSSTI